MKKLMTLFACLGLAITMASCSSTKVDEAALDKLETVAKKFTEVSSYDYSVTLVEKVEKISAKISGSFSATDGIQLSGIVDLEADGTAMDKFIEIYMKENMMYMSMLGTKIKSEVDLTAIDGLTMNPDEITIDKEVMKKYLSEATLKGNTLHLTFDPKSFSEVDLAVSETSADDIKELSMDITLEDDFMKSATLSTTAEIEGKKQTITITLALDKVNAVESIEFPSDLDSYILDESNSALNAL